MSSAEIFPHIRILLGTVIGLGLVRLLMTVAAIVQHPQRAKSSPLHLLWLGSMVIELILFWWWEFALFHLQTWTFGVTLFLVAYAVMLFLLAALLSPDNISEYDGYEDFFLKRRQWFFGLFAVVALFDVIDTLLKGAQYWERFGPSYFLQAPIGIVICIIACYSANRRLHLGIVGLHIAYQLFQISRYFNG